MSSRIAHLLLVAVLLLGQVGGWLHEMSHYAGTAGQTTARAVGDTGSGTPPDGFTDQQCLVCLTFTAMALALPGFAVPLALLALGFALPAGARLLAAAVRRSAHHARGPPALS